MTPSHLNREDVMLSCSKENSGWLRIATTPAPQDGRWIHVKGPRGGKMRARYGWTPSGITCWHTTDRTGERVAIGFDEWMPITKRKRTP